jgi:hypothetical protein
VFRNLVAQMHNSKATKEAADSDYLSIRLALDFSHDRFRFAERYLATPFLIPTFPPLSEGS